MKLEDIKDPRLRKRIEDALVSVGDLKRDLSVACPKNAMRIRQDQKPLMNKLEEEFYLTHGLPSMKSAVTVQGIRFRLGNGIWYKPDFVIWNPVRPRAIEVKGPHAFRGGFENLKVAASLYQWIDWRLVWKEDGEWCEQSVKP